MSADFLAHSKIAFSSGEGGPPKVVDEEIAVIPCQKYKAKIKIIKLNLNNC